MLVLVILCVSSAQLSWREGSSFSSTILPSPISVNEESSTCSSGEDDFIHFSMECLNCSGNEESCPAGLFCSGGLCKCRKLPNDLVRCEGEGNTTSLMVLNNYCATFDEQEKAVLVGACVESIFTTMSLHMFHTILFALVSLMSFAPKWTRWVHCVEGVYMTISSWLILSTWPVSPAHTPTGTGCGTSWLPTSLSLSSMH